MLVLVALPVGPLGVEEVPLAGAHLKVEVPGEAFLLVVDLAAGAPEVAFLLGVVPVGVLLVEASGLEVDPVVAFLPVEVLDQAVEQELSGAGCSLYPGSPSRASPAGRPAPAACWPCPLRRVPSF